MKKGEERCAAAVEILARYHLCYAPSVPEKANFFFFRIEHDTDFRKKFTVFRKNVPNVLTSQYSRTSGHKTNVHCTNMAVSYISRLHRDI